MLSEKQILFRDYLIKKLGFVEEAFLIEYLERLTNTAPKYRYLEAIPVPEDYKVIDDFGETAYAIEGEQYRSYDMKNDLFVPRRYSIIDFLNFEHRTKKNLQIKLKETATTYTSATDIANFTYCPVSFSISKTFDLKKIESAYHGTDLHESHRLINFLPSEAGISKNIHTEFSQSERSLIKPENEHFFKDIKGASLVYHGHSMNQQRKYFKSIKGDYVGQPDYILQNSNGIFFAVEEKFQHQIFFQNKIESHFHDNHINQLTSYLYGIPDYDIQYGYLVYWKFDFDYGQPFLHACHVTRVEKNEMARNQIAAIYSKLKNLVKNKTESFDIKTRNPNKCANCVSNLLCGHKTGRFPTLKYPYSTDYMKTYYAEFPKELKKDSPPEDGNEKLSKILKDLDPI